MHTRKIHTLVRRFSALLAVLLMASLPALADAVTGQSNTKATVTFKDGELALGGKMQGSGLSFEFGEHVIPVKAETYPAENSKDGQPVAHVLPVEDSRYASGNWHVTAQMTAFTDSPDEPTSSFNAIVRLVNPTLANENTSAGLTGLTKVDTISIASGASAVLVLSADDTLVRGNYSATWKNEDVTLNIGDSEVTQIGPFSYDAAMTWTLSIGPM